MKKPRIVIKVGTNVLQRPNGKLDYNVISELGEQIAAIHDKECQVLFVSSGAVGAGREQCSFENEKRSIVREQMMAAVGQVRLMQIYSDFFLEHHITIAQILLTRSDFGNRSSYLNIRNTLDGLLDSGVVPIVNENDVVATEELEALASNFGDNDQLAVFTAALIGADRVFFLTTAPGLLQYYDKNSSRKESPPLIREIQEFNQDLLKHCDPKISSGGRGGMASKVKAAAMAMSFGIHAHIVPGKEQNVVFRILDGESLGTHFVASGKKIRSYQKWLAAGALSKGRIWIDDGAENALVQNKKSLLAKGVTKVEGKFEEKDLVDIYNDRGNKIGVGRINVTLGELKQQLQQKQENVSSENIHTIRKPIISRDYLYLR